MKPPEEHYDELPRAIIARLEARDREVRQITPRVDAAIARRATEHFAARRGSSRATARRWAWPAAAAAALVLAIVITQRFDERAHDASFAADDIDRSGRVDVLDAFALSRMRITSPTQVEQGDIERLMARIVSLGPAGGAL